MNKFKNLFRHSKTVRRDDEEDHFMGKENQRPAGVHFKPQTKSKKGLDALDMTATACYHTQVAPKTRRGPKSCPGGMSDDMNGGHVNRSFETEIPVRVRRQSPDFSRERESTRQKRPRHAQSEYGGPVQSSHIAYREVEVPSDGEEDPMVRELRKKLHFMSARKHYYKTEFMEVRGRERSDRKAHEDFLQRQIQERDRQIQERDRQLQERERQVQERDIRIHMLEKGLREMQHKCSCQPRQQPLMFNNPNPFSQPSFNQTLYPNFSMDCSNTRDSVISDPQPPHFPAPSNDVHGFMMPSTADFSRFENEDRDETKVFRSRESQSSLMRSSIHDSF